MCIHVPPLRNRQDDIAPLAQFFLEQQEQPFRFSPEALDALARYHWPGNVRELRNAVVQAAVMADGEVVEPGHLPFLVQNAPVPARPVTLDDMEREMILRVLTDTSGQQKRAADILGISLRTLGRKLKQY